MIVVILETGEYTGHREKQQSFLELTPVFPITKYYGH
jgi:hypothetical protein